MDWRKIQDLAIMNDSEGTGNRRYWWPFRGGR